MTADVRTLFLDAGGVLVHPDWERVAATLARHGTEISADALRAAEPHAKFDLDVPDAMVGTNDDDRGPMFFRLVLQHAGLDAGAPNLAACWEELRAYHDEHNLWDVVPEGVPGALDSLRAAGYGLTIVSNAGPNLDPLLERVGLRDRFDHVVISAVIGIEKPDSGIFHHALRVSGADAASTVHVGDYWEIDVVGARAAGLRAILVDPGDLYDDRDVERVPDLATLVETLTSFRS